MSGPNFVPEGFMPRAGGKIELALEFFDSAKITHECDGSTSVRVTGTIVTYLPQYSLTVGLRGDEACKLNPRTSVLPGCRLRFTGQVWNLTIDLSKKMHTVHTIQQLQDPMPCLPIQERF